MVFKHLADRYNIYYLYSTSVISPNIHQTAINFVFTSFFFMLLQLTAFLNAKNHFTFHLKPANMCTLALIIYLIYLMITCSNMSVNKSKYFASPQPPMETDLVPLPRCRVEYVKKNTSALEKQTATLRSQPSPIRANLQSRMLRTEPSLHSRRDRLLQTLTSSESSQK